MIRRVKACALYITSLSTSKQALKFCVVLLPSTANHLVSLLIFSSAEDMKEKSVRMPTPRFVLSIAQHAALIY